MQFVAIVNVDASLISLSVFLLLLYYEANKFLELILYPTLLNMIISCRSALVELLGSLMYTIISSANNKSLAFSFPI